ncbi:lipoyl(octanoyl) transferase LipB [Nakamurella aerolata]|uniref:Octanoyltransferase n=1 Tax=Nakamurella aerolata TaxID=1656892 RepID=A0A849AGD5_9ACTN|nr:lipoyl(octanoyl) transferase LipB [Nakamurella aerolata]NNG37510.1 lipoyl(octanoyl) transferase LipB [Nakamurella aerolata]
MSVADVSIPSRQTGLVTPGTAADIEFAELGLVDYLAAWQQQKALAAEVQQGNCPGRVLLLEHPDVYTAGRRTQPADRPTDGTPVVDVDRGGRITWHGPGQLVGYPILKLSEPIDVVHYVRTLEEVLIAACSDLGVATGRVDGRSGVWLPAGDGRPERKIAAIGVRIARGVTQHGFALNCNPDMAAFDRIVPCGIADAGVTSLTTELGREVLISEALAPVTARLRQALDGVLTVRSHPLPAAQRPAGVDWQLDRALG